jgi:hypothetical protein
MNNILKASREQPLMSRFIRSFKARKIFLDQLGVGNSISFSAHAAGGTAGNFRRWRQDDENFAQDWDDAIEQGTDFIEDVATDRAMKKSDALMAMILKARRPEKFDRGSKLELSGGISVDGSKQKLLNRIARLAAAGQMAQALPQGEQAVPEEVGEETQKLLPPPPGDPLPRGSKRRAVHGGDRRKAAS